MYSTSHELAARASLRARAFSKTTVASRPLMYALGRGALAGPRLLTATRPAVNLGLSLMSPVPRETRTTTIRETTADGQVRGEWIHTDGGLGVPDPASPASIVYYLHGSGYVICSPRTHRGLVARLTRRAGIGAFSLDYRLGPEYRWPSAGDDAVRGYRWLLAQGFDAEQIVVAGDSAGGHLALDLLAANHRDGVPQPRAMALFSPLYDPTFQLARDLESRGVRDPIIDVTGAARFLGLYTAGADPDHPRMRIRLTPDMDLPPTLIQVGSREIMADDARTIHRRLLDAGGLSELQEWQGQGHVFQMFPYFTPESGKAVRAAAEFIAEHSVLP
ncbi:alpha/beta hydrolase [Gordonia neofelifaecis]|uniref:Alpha/beta hydrolase fold-3 domain-containing protein n=1 Tax=Gordonia neofelifaecis NRRL B-59395 TaxID=644548 RepID=F1YL22_9ACTN|nr:alpha/beta hydrolase [Gordonia neofelifaecis]EGD54627.1 alpha/beta hydrolase fold-3 domain-containing protein [Gordonia neofelifaecis NRRL B-59395]